MQERSTDDYFTLLDWRRCIADLYAEVRTRLATDPVKAHARWRERRDDLFRSHPQSPLPADERAAFRGLRYFEYDPRFAFTAKVRSAPPESSAAPRKWCPAGALGDVFIRVGIVDLPVGTLEVLWLDAYGGGLFLPFRDASSGHATYGGGRYLLDTAKGADLGARGDEFVLDFNFAYQPSCAYDPKWACPLAPTESTSAVAIEAGERR